MKIFDAIQQVTPCPVTRSTGCQCDRLERINEAEETIKAIAQLEHTVGDVQGAIKFKQKPGQPTIIKGIVKGLTPGKHGFHIHEFGDLSKGCESAGAHYNPDGVEHGSLQQGHVGDLGNIIADKSGTARFQIKAERVELSDVVGRAIVIHADEDDLGKGGDEESLKTGNAGERVGCGVIRLKEVVEEEYKRKISDKHFDRNQLPQIRRPDIDDSPFEYKEGSISLSKLKPVQTQRVKGLSKKAQNVFLSNEDRPFILDKNGYIINGHHRYDAANMLGLKKVKAIKIDADIEDVMNHFADKSSDREVMPEHYFKKLYEKKLKEKGTRCWKGYTKKGMKTMFGKRVPNCVKNEDVTESVYPDTMTGNQMLKWLNDLHKWDGGIRNPEYKNDVRKNTWALINKFPLAKLQNTTGYVPDEEDTDDPYNRVIDPDMDHAMQTDLSKPIVVSSDRTTVLDGNHRVAKAREMGKTHLPAYFPMKIDENFADGKKKGKSRPGRVKKAGASCKGSVTSLRAKAKKYSGERGKMYHWCANMKSGKS